MSASPSHPGADSGSSVCCSVSPPTAPVGSNPGRRLSSLHGRQIANRDAEADAIRAGIAAGLTIAAAGRQAGLAPERVKYLAKFYKLKSDPEALKRKRLLMAATNLERTALAQNGGRVRNAGLTEAQRKNVEAIKARSWCAGRNMVMRHLPTPTRDEADALVAQFLARGGRITVAPPAAPVEIPNNAGMPFRVGRRA